MWKSLKFGIESALKINSDFQSTDTPFPKTLPPPLNIHNSLKWEFQELLETLIVTHEPINFITKHELG